MTIYAILNRHAKDWWYHTSLRSKGETAEARKRERHSIRNDVRNLREALANGGYMHIGRGGWTLYLSDNATLSHYGGIEEPIPQAALKLGIPIIDTTTISGDKIMGVLKLPIIAIGADKVDAEPWGSFSYAPLAYVSARYVELGATRYN